MEVGDSIHLLDIKLPEGVAIRELEVAEPFNRTVATMQAPTLEPVKPEEHEEAAGTHTPDADDDEARKLQAQDDTHDAPKSDD